MKTQMKLPVVLVSVALVMPAIGVWGQTSQPMTQGQVLSKSSQDQAALEKKSAELSKQINQQRIYPTLKMAQDILKNHPNDAEAHRTQAEHYAIEQGQFQNELRERREAMRCNPDNPYDIVSLGSMERFVNRPEALHLLASVANGPYDGWVKQQAKNTLAYVLAHPQPSNAH